MKLILTRTQILDLKMALILPLRTIQVLKWLINMHHLNHVLVWKKYGNLIYKKRFLIWIPRAGTFGNIPTKVLKDSSNVCNSVLKDIWNYEILGKQYFTKNLKLNDIPPLYQKKDPTLFENYRPGSALPCVSKGFKIITVTTGICSRTCLA